MKVYFMFKPCKTDAAYEVIFQGKIDREKIIKSIIETFNGKITADTSFLTVIDIGKAKISVSKNNKILIRGIKEEERAREIANKIIKVLVL